MKDLNINDSDSGEIKLSQMKAQVEKSVDSNKMASMERVSMLMWTSKKGTLF